MEDFNHFLIRNLSKIVIVETNRFEHRVVFEAHYVVGLPPQFGKAVARRHRHRKHKPLRIAHASGAQSRTGRRARRNTKGLLCFGGSSSPRCSILTHFWVSNSTQAMTGMRN